MSSNCFGPACDFLIMKLKFNNKKVSIDMRECLNKAVDDFDDIGLVGLETPAKNNLKVIKLGSPIIDEERRNKFHSIAMLIAHVEQRGRRDLQPICSFLSQ